ncbi:MAG: hypothetical protein ABW187_08745 [Dokdonella sp.]
MKVLIAASLALCASLAFAQTPAPASAAAPAAPLDLQVPAEDAAHSNAAGGADSPGAYYGDVSGNDADKATTVHGSFTTGIGYSKGYGTSTMNAAELDISSQYGDGKTFDVHINVEQSRGLPGGYYGYGSRYHGY